MSNLTTRKIVLGLLMALVLTFSVQGTADAADLPVIENIRRSSDEISGRSV